MGRTPLLRNLSRIQRGDGAILTFFTMRAV